MVVLFLVVCMKEDDCCAPPAVHNQHIKTTNTTHQQAGELPTSISGACMDGKFMTPAEFRKLEKMPTKQELIATIARLIKQVPTKVAVSVKQVPTKLAYGVKALADADENKEALLGDVCKPESA